MFKINFKFNEFDIKFVDYLDLKISEKLENKLKKQKEKQTKQEQDSKNFKLYRLILQLYNQLYGFYYNILPHINSKMNNQFKIIHFNKYLKFSKKIDKIFDKYIYTQSSKSKTMKVFDICNTYSVDIVDYKQVLFKMIFYNLKIKYSKSFKNINPLSLLNFSLKTCIDSNFNSEKLTELPITLQNDFLKNISYNNEINFDFTFSSEIEINNIDLYNLIRRINNESFIISNDFIQKYINFYYYF
jgi:hypothetical protein